MTFSKPQTYKTRTVLTAKKRESLLKATPKIFNMTWFIARIELYFIFIYHSALTQSGLILNVHSRLHEKTQHEYSRSPQQTKNHKTRNACTPWTVGVLSCREWDICTLRASCTRTWSRRTFFMTPIKWWSQTSGSLASLESFKRGGKKRHSGGLKNTTSAKVLH